jgi:glycosyltransferase involved in cell wall biosynthesis
MMQNPLENIIAPEIRDDELSRLLTSIAAREPLQWVLEIGSSTGEGSTASLVKGLKQNPARPILFCLEASRQRFSQLKARYVHDSFVKCMNASSVAIDCFPARSSVTQFWESTTTKLTDYTNDMLLGWLEADICSLRESGIAQGGIDLIKNQYNIDLFDMVLIGGSEFTGEAELEELYGARWIVLDSINTYKNYNNYQRLVSDVEYVLIAENRHLCNGYAVFRHKEVPLPVHFFTIVLNGMPFITHHIDVFRHLPFRWHWHIVEGVAELVNDTGWSTVRGGHIPASYHNEGRSVDGTTDYIDALQELYHDSITIYRKPLGQLWHGKLEMVNAPIQEIQEPCLLWEIDADECWTHAQLCDGWRMFDRNPDKTAAYYWCHFFVGPHLVVSSRNCYSQVAGQEWLRTWRYTPDCIWVAHEPPRLVHGTGQPVEVHPFSNDETEEYGLVFQHFAYTTAEQVRFKEKYYGYLQATFHWLQLQKERHFPQYLREYLPWVCDKTLVNSHVAQGIVPLPVQAKLNNTSKQFSSKIVIDGVFFQYRVTGIARVWLALLEQWCGTRFASMVVILDRGRTAPRIEGYCYLDIPLHNELALEAEQVMLQDVCNNLVAGLFISTWHTSPLTTKSLLMVHDMIPERLLGERRLAEPRWREKKAAIEQATGYVSVSKSTAHDLVAYYPEAVEKAIHVIHNGVAENFAPVGLERINAFLVRHHIEKPYYLFIGPREWYKNFLLLLDAFQLMSNASEYCIVSPHGDNLENEFRNHPAAAAVLITGRLSDDELVTAYCGAIALIYPSLNEGFGLPPLEAMACGCPVISSNIKVLEEVCGDAAMFVSPDSPEALSRAMQAFQNQAKRLDYIQRGLERATTFTWTKTASQLLRAISGMLGLQMGLDNIYLEKVRTEHLD